EPQPVTVTPPVISEDGTTAAYRLAFPNLAGVGMEVEVSVADDTLTMRLADVTDPDGVVETIRIPDLDLVTVGSTDPASQLTAGLLGSGDSFENLSTATAGETRGSWLVLANDSHLAAAFEAGAIRDSVDERWQRRV